MAGHLHLTGLMTGAEWKLPTGETVIATLDPSTGNESVYLGPRLVSRAKRGSAPRGHVVPMRGGEQSAYRGAADVRVFFDAHPCRLVIDGIAVKDEDARPVVDLTRDDPSLARWKRIKGVHLAIMFLVMGCGLLAFIKSKGFGAEPGASTPWFVAFFALLGLWFIVGFAMMRCPRCGVSTLSRSSKGLTFSSDECAACGQPLD